MSDLQKSASRDAYYDNLRLFLMFCVVLCHCLELMRDGATFLAQFHEVILAFVMPLFVFVTGFFAKGMAKADSPKRMRIWNIALMYVIAQAIKMAISGGGSFFKPSYGNWYLMCMVVWYTILPLVAKFKPAIAIGLSVIAAVLVGMDPVDPAVFQLSRVFCFFPFFLMGFFFTKEQAAELRKPAVRKIGWLILVAVIAFDLLVWQKETPMSLMHAAKNYATLKITNWEGCGMRLAWYLLCSVMGFGVLSVIPQKETKLTVLGTRTLPIFIIHTCVYLYLTKHTEFFELIKAVPNEYLRIGCALLLSLVVTLVCGNKYFAKLFDWIMSYDFCHLMKKEEVQQ